MAIAAAAAATERLVRGSLALSCPLNLTASWAFAVPSSLLGQQLGLPVSVEPLYAGLCGLFVGLFGIVYGWLAMQRRLDQPLLWLGVVGKAGFFLLVVALWLRQLAEERLLAAASLDMALAVLWCWWLMRTRLATAVEARR